MRGRLAIAAHAAQAVVLVGLASWLRGGWPALALVAAAGAAGELAAAAAHALGRPERARWGSLVALAVAALLVGLWVDAAITLARRFGPVAASTGLRSFGALAGALPWLVAVPALEVARGRPPRGRGALLLAALVLPPVVGAARRGPAARHPAQPALLEAAAGAWARWQGREAAIPDGPEAVVVLTPWRAGRAGRSAVGRGAGLREAVEAALAELAPPEGADAALELDVVRAEWRSGPAPPGRTAALAPGGARSAAALVHGGDVRRVAVLPLWRVPSPVVGRGRRPALVDAALADASGARPLLEGWTAPPPLTADEAIRAAAAGGRMLLRHQSPEGRYAYVVQGPTGRRGPGYNLPRHAGATWFLARLAARTGDPAFARGADRALGWMLARSAELDGGRLLVRDPGRRDGRAWVGTTALALLAALERGHPDAPAMARFVASAVDAAGQVRGEVDLATGRFPQQPRNPYAQGQALLALAAAVRAGIAEVRPALERAAAFSDGGYAPRGAARLGLLDEHWACLAALAARDALGRPAGWATCRAYAWREAAAVPPPPSALGPAAGSAGGAAEAVVAAAVLDPAGPWRRAALAFARLFLARAYRAGDRPLLADPAALLGGFRDRPWQLAVRVDAVQHVGCALLGVEALLAGARRPGSLP